MSYQKTRGAFLKYAAVSIKNRLIDYARRESRHAGTVSLDHSESDEDDRAMVDRLEDDRNEIREREDHSSARTEIAKFSAELAEYGLSLTEIAENCPRQKRTLEACHRALAYARENQELLQKLVSSKKLPLSQLAAGSGTEVKTLERHRKYMVAVLLAYTNGFEIIRGHLRQMAPAKGGRTE